MAEAEELKSMVICFRRNELVELLGFVGMNKNGVKATLLQRAEALINSSRGCSVPVQIKIRELYRQIHNPFAAEPPRSRVAHRAQVQVSDPRARRYGATGKMPGQPLSTSGMGSSSMSSGAVDFSKRSQDMTGVPSLPVHPDVRVKPLPFYDIMGELLKPTSLAPKSVSRYQETYFVFHLTPQQAQDIAMSRDFRPSAKWEYTVQVQLRFCFLETSCEQDDNFPPSICVRVNGKVASLPNPIPTTKPGVEPKRPGRPVDITSLCRLSPTMPNHVEISWASEFGRGFVVSINLVKRLSSDTLLQRLKQFGNRHADHSRAMIKEKLQHDADSEIATTSLRVSLTCPLGKMRMQLPSRASTCTHLQCFDATTYLMMNEKKATWMCPVCDKPAPFHKLIIDGLFSEILKAVADHTEIQFVEDGSWSPITKSKETLTIGTPVAKQTVSDSSDKTVNLCGDASPEPESSPANKKPRMEVIDLTLSDSDDDDEPPARPPSSHEISSGTSSPALSRVGPGTGCSTPDLSNGNSVNSVTSISGLAGSSTGHSDMPPLMCYSRASGVDNTGSIQTSAGRSQTVSLASPTPLSLSLNASGLDLSTNSHLSNSALGSSYSSNISGSHNISGSVSFNGVLGSPTSNNAYSPSAVGMSNTASGAVNTNVGASGGNEDSGISTGNVAPASWLTALTGGGTQQTSTTNQSGMKRPSASLAGASSSVPAAKRQQLMEKTSTDSPNSSNSNMSPLVDLDQLCSILDSDRDRNNEEIASALRFSPEFQLPGNLSSAASSRDMFPDDDDDDIIALD